MHALANASAVELLNSTAASTGDQGTESGFWLFTPRLTKLFGDWVLAAADDVEGEGEDEPGNVEGLLRHVCRLLSRRYSRERFKETCFTQRPLSLLKHLLDSFNYEVYEDRWNSIFAALGALLVVEDIVRSAWSLLAYLRGSQRAEERDGDKALDV